MPASPDNQNLYFVMNSYLLYILKANISAQTSFTFIFNNRGSFEGLGYLLKEVERIEAGRVSHNLHYMSLRMYLCFFFFFCPVL